MKLKCYDVEWMFNDFENLYFMDENGKAYYWYTKSDKAFEQIHVDTVIEVTSFKNGEQWHMDGEEFNTITNVRFKVLDEELITETAPDIRQEIINDLLELARKPYKRYRQSYEVNGHFIDFAYSQKMMYAVSIDNAYYQIHDMYFGKNTIVDTNGEYLTEMQYILKRLGLEYTDVEY